MATPVDDEWEYSPPPATDDEWEYAPPQVAAQPTQSRIDNATRGFNTGLAGAVGFPVDAVNSALGSLGVPVSDAPVGGSRFFKGLMDKAGTLAPEANDSTGRAIQKVGEYAGAGAAFGPAAILPGAVAGVGAATAREIAPDSDVGEFIGAMTPATARYAAGAALNKVRPHNLVAKRVNKAMATPFAKEGEQLERATGIHLTPGQLTGDKGILMMEGMARQHPFAASRVQSQIDEPQLQKAVENLNKMMDRMDNRGFGPAQVGNDIKGAFDAALNKATEVRRAQAAQDYGSIKLSANKQPIVGTSNIRSEIDNIVSEFDVPGGEAIVKQAKAFAKMVGKKPMTAEKAMKARSLYSSMARGTGQIFKDIDKGQSRMLAARLEAALSKDLDAAETVGGSIGQSLRAANSNYRANSQAIEQLEHSTLGRLFGGKYDPDPQVVAERMLKMKPTEMSTAAGILHSSNPKVMQGVKRFALEKAMEKAIPAPTAGGQGVKFSAAKFVSALPDEAFLRSVYSPGEVAEIKNLSSALERIANRGGTGGSQTAPLMMTYDAAKALFTLNVPALARLGASVIAPNKIASAMATKEGRKALRTIITTRNPDMAMRVGAYFAAREE